MLSKMIPVDMIADTPFDLTDQPLLIDRNREFAAGKMIRTLDRLRTLFLIPIPCCNLVGTVIPIDVNCR